MADSPQSGGGRRRTAWADYAPFAAIAIVMGLILLSGKALDRPPVPAGTPLPRITAEGWLNVPEGTRSVDVAGKVVVVDCWATWCPPCRAALPGLARIARKYRPLGVEFLGLTRETQRDLDAIRGVVRSTEGFVWPVGYGVEGFYRDLDIGGIPTVIVFDRAGRATYSHVGDGHEAALEAALDAALAK